MAEPYPGPFIVEYARFFSKECSESLKDMAAVVNWMEMLDGDGYALAILTEDGRMLWERHGGGPSLQWHVRAIDAPPLPADSGLYPWTPPKPKRQPRAPKTCPDCGAPTVKVGVESLRCVVARGSTQEITVPGAMTVTCENGHQYGPEVPPYPRIASD